MMLGKRGEGRIVLPEPEMVENVVDRVSGPPVRLGIGILKRVRAELCTLLEDSLEDVYNAADAARHNAAPPNASPSVVTSLPDEHEGWSRRSPP
jgi:hypothetical protein